MNFASKTKFVGPVLASALVLSGVAACSSKVSKSEEREVASSSTSKSNSSFSSNSKSGFHLPEFEEKTLDNGLRILFINDKSLPYVSFSMLVKSGANQDTEELSGLTSFVAELLDKGTSKHTAPQLAQDLGQMGAEFDASAGNDYTMITASSLSMTADHLLEDYHEIITQPAFSEQEIGRTRQQLSEMVQRRVDHPEVFADQAFESQLYGAHPYARAVSGTVKTLAGIKKKNIIQNYLKNYRPNNAILAVVGKYTPEFAKKVETAFGTWQKRDVPAVVFSPIAASEGVQIKLIDKPGLIQAQVRMGNVGIKRTNPDFLALRVANSILGGDLSSRLMKKIRTELGLTYGITSRFDARLDAGPFEISSFTKNESTGQLITETMKVLKTFREDGVSSAEVDSVKGYLKGVFPAAIETPEKLAVNLLILRFYGIADSYLTNYIHDVDALSTRDVNKVVKKYFDERNFRVLVYSTASAVQPQLEAIGKVEVKSAADAQ